MTAPCCRIKIKAREVDTRRLERAIGGLFQLPATEIAAAFRLVVRDIPPELDQKMSATSSLSEAVYLLKQILGRYKAEPQALPSLARMEEKAVLIRNVACFCRRPAES